MNTQWKNRLHRSFTLPGLLCAVLQSPFAEASPANTKPGLPLTIVQTSTSENTSNWRVGVPHNHSTLSDGADSWSAMLSGYNAISGIEWAAMTDHYPDRYWGLAWMSRSEYGKQYDRIRDYWQLTDFAGVPGMEVSPYKPFCCEYQHVIGLFKSWYVPQKVNPGETAALIREIHNAGGFPVVAHPYDDVYGNFSLRQQISNEVLKKDAAGKLMPFGMEIINESMDNLDRRSVDVWLTYLLRGARALPFYGRDAHSLVHHQGTSTGISGAAAVVPYAKAVNMWAIVDALRQGKFYISTGSGVAIWVRATDFDASDYRWMGSTVTIPTGGHTKWDIVVSASTPTLRRLRVLTGKVGASEETLLSSQDLNGSTIKSIPINLTSDMYVRAEIVQIQASDDKTDKTDEAYSSPIWFDLP
jgi:hypothetical protein